MINRPIYVDKIMAYADTPFVKILTGIRRCGKSTILKMLIKEMKKKASVTIRFYITVLILWNMRTLRQRRGCLCI